MPVFRQQPQPQLLFAKLLSQPHPQPLPEVLLVPNTQERTKRRMIHEQLLPPKRLLHILSSDLLSKEPRKAFCFPLRPLSFSLYVLPVEVFLKSVFEFFCYFF